MADEANIARLGLPWDTVNSAIFRSPKLRASEVAKVAAAFDEPLPPAVIQQVGWGKTWGDLISVTEPADGSGGVMMTLITDDLPAKQFHDKIRDVRDNQFQDWMASYGMRTEWGRADTGYHPYESYQSVIEGLPDHLRERAEMAIGRLKPYTSQIGTYHDSLRATAPGAEVIHERGTLVHPVAQP